MIKGKGKGKFEIKESNTQNNRTVDDIGIDLDVILDRRMMLTIIRSCSIVIRRCPSPY